MEPPADTENAANLPGHIAIIMDGNGRWANQRSLPRLKGHRAGAQNVRSVVNCLNQYQIKYVTLFTFSTENWNRPQDEVNGLFRLFENTVKRYIDELDENNIRLRHLGRIGQLPPSLQSALQNAVAQTANNTGMTLSFAINYGGRAEITDAVRRIAADKIPPQEIDEKLIGNYLYTAGLPDVDLLIRTSGEYRVSNFLTWQTTYSEFYFTDVYWPDFDKLEVEKALAAYSRRKRRFGKVK